MMNGMQVQHTRICTLIGPAWFHFVPKLLLYVSWTPSPSESLSFIAQMHAHFPPVYRHAACPAEREPSNQGIATGLQMPTSEFSPPPTAQEHKDLRLSPTLAMLTAKQRRVLRVYLKKRKKSFLFSYQLVSCLTLMISC